MTLLYVFMDYSTIFSNAASWLLNQASWVIVAALVILGLQAWMNGRIMALFGGLIVAGILILISTNSDPNTGIVHDLSTAIQHIFDGTSTGKK